jgi:hypothetical protein
MRCTLARCRLRASPGEKSGIDGVGELSVKRRRLPQPQRRRQQQERPADTQERMRVNAAEKSPRQAGLCAPEPRPPAQ